MNKTQFNEFNDTVKELFAKEAGHILSDILYFFGRIEEIKIVFFEETEKKFLNLFELCYRDEFGDPDYDDCYMDLVGVVQDMIAKIKEIKKVFDDEYYSNKEYSKDFKLNKQNLYLKIKEFYIPKIVKCLVEDYGIKSENFIALDFSNDLNLKELIKKL